MRRRDSKCTILLSWKTPNRSIADVSIFRQICFADFASSQRQCLLLCVFESVFCVNGCSWVAKMLTNTYMDSHMSNRTVQVPCFYSVTLTFIFKAKYCWQFSCFVIISQTVRDRANITVAVRQEIIYSLSNGPAASVVRHDLDLYFQGHGFWNLNISQTVRDSTKMLCTTCI